MSEKPLGNCVDYNHRACAAIQPMTESHRYRGIPYSFNRLAFHAEYRMKTKSPLFLPWRVDVSAKTKEILGGDTLEKCPRLADPYRSVCSFALRDTQTRFDSLALNPMLIRSVKNISS